MLVVGGCSSHASAPIDRGGGDGDMGPPALAIAPPTATVGFGGVQPFSANRPVTWDVVEPGGGSIDTDGRYTAPFSPGTFHVHAATTDAPSQQATAAVTVGDHSITLVAGSFGGPGNADDKGAAARFADPRHLVFDGTRYVYFGDFEAVRRLDITTGEVVTLAGQVSYWNGNVDGVGSAAKFGRAWSVALDGNGAVYISDSANDTLRKLDLATRTVTTVAGQAGSPGSTDGKGTAALLNFPSGLALDAAAGKLYIGDGNNGSIRVYDLATTMVSTLVTGLGAPDGLALDGTGTLYVADAAANVVFAVNIGARTSTVVAGGGRGFRDGVGQAAHFDSIGPLALLAGALYVGDTLGLRKIDLGSKQVTTIPVRGGSARSIIGLVSDGSGHLLASAESDFAIERVDPSAGSTTVVAGPTGAGSGNVDGTGAAARLHDPGQLVADGAGSLYVSDVGNSEVRKVDLSSGSVATLVGSAWSGDLDGVGRAAHFDHPESVASDHAGTLFVVEPNAGTVRKWVTATNSVTTLAGSPANPGVDDGTGTAARFEAPTASCFDSGALYVVDQLNHDVRKIVVATGVVTRLAGSGEDPGGVDGVGTTARFSHPLGIACDGAGYAYVADNANDAIRRIQLSSGTVDTVAGVIGAGGEVDMPGSAARFNSPAAMAFAAGYLYVVDNGYVNLHLRKIQLGTWAVQTIATSTITGQNFYGVAVDGSGNVYLSDKQYGSSIVYTVAGGTLTPLAGSASNTGLAIDAVGSAANFYGAAGMTADGTTLYVADDGAALVRKIDLSNAAVSSPVGLGPESPSVAGTGGNAFVYQPGGLAFDGSGALVVADAWTLDRVTVPGAALSVAAGAYGIYGGMDGVGSAARVFPSAVVSDGNGTFYFTGANTVRRYVAASGQVDTLAGVEGTKGSADGTKSAAQFDRPKGIAADGAGNLYVSDTNNYTIRKVVIATGEVTTFAGVAGTYGAVDGVGSDARFFLPMGMTYDGKGALYVADSQNGAIRRVDLATRAVTTYAGVLGQKGLLPGPLPARLNAPRGVALLPDGGLAVTDEQAVVVIH